MKAKKKRREVQVGNVILPIENESELFSYYMLYAILSGLKAHLAEINIVDRCDGTLKLTKRYLKKWSFNDDMYRTLMDVIEHCGYYCDCEVLLNIEYLIVVGVCNEVFKMAV